jgi:hypothetical protein
MSIIPETNVPHPLGSADSLLSGIPRVLPITFDGALTELGPSDLAELLGACHTWPVRVPAETAESAGLPVRTKRHELEELAVSSALRTRLERNLPYQVHVAVLAGATLSEVAAATGWAESEILPRWRAWAADQVAVYLVSGRIGVSEAVFAQVRDVLESGAPGLTSDVARDGR